MKERLDTMQNRIPQPLFVLEMANNLSQNPSSTINDAVVSISRQKLASEERQWRLHKD
jgi:hypothetical protein